MSRFSVPSGAIGWFQVAYSDEVAEGEVRPLRYFHRELVLWRTPSGIVSLADAHCPHLGAHLGYGGALHGDNLRCPLHGREYAAHGAAVVPSDVPCAIRRAGLRTYPVVERNSLVLAWFHPAGSPPLWEIPEAPEIVGGSFLAIDRHHRTVRTIWQEVAENMLDLSHVSTLHGLEPYSRHAVEQEGYFRRLTMAQPLRTAFGTVSVDMTSDHHGPGYAIARFGESLIMISAFSPVGDELLDIRFTFFARDLGTERRTRRVGEFLVNDLIRQTDQHVPLWENKAYIADPELDEGDGPIRQFREWASQFYVT